jgi:hypothetical protein
MFRDVNFLDMIMGVFNGLMKNSSTLYDDLDAMSDETEAFKVNLNFCIIEEELNTAGV